MGWDDCQGIIRHVLTTAAGGLVANGTVTSDQAQQIIGGIMAILTIAWSLYQKRQQRQALVEAKTGAKS